MGHVDRLVSVNDHQRRSKLRFLLIYGSHSIIQGLAILGVFLTYFPTKHSRMQGMRKSEILKRIDWVGGALLTTGFTLV
jgi:hypothetical protein